MTDKWALEAQAALFEADEPVLADDDVVEQLDVEHFACLAQLLSGADVLFGIERSGTQSDAGALEFIRRRS